MTKPDILAVAGFLKKHSIELRSSDHSDSSHKSSHKTLAQAIEVLRTDNEWTSELEGFLCGLALSVRLDEFDFNRWMPASSINKRLRSWRVRFKTPDGRPITIDVKNTDLDILGMHSIIARAARDAERYGYTIEDSSLADPQVERL